MKTGPKGLALIKSFEGLFLEAYDDEDDRILKPGDRCYGVLTIGYGHTSAAGPPRVYVGQVISPAVADDILASDLTSVEIEIDHLVKRLLDQNQFDALVSFQFNTGWLAHPQCSLLKALNAGNFALAKADFALYDRASGKVEYGLVRRRAEEAKLFNTPTGA
jgi:lysozyme